MAKVDFINRVMQIMNEVGWNDTSSSAFIGSNTSKVERHIEGVFVDAWRRAVDLLPKRYFDVKDFSDSRLMPDIKSGTGRVVLPDDFYLLSCFCMDGWERGVNSLSDVSDEVGSVQLNEYTRGNYIRPVCVRRVCKIGDVVHDVIEYYSVKKGAVHRIREALYIPMAEPLSDDTILNDRLFAPLAYLCACLVFCVFEKPDMAKVFEGKAVEMGK